MYPQNTRALPPFIRLEGDFCGMPFSVMRVFLWQVGGIMSMVVGFVTGAMILAGRAGEFLGMFLYLMLLIPIFLPFISTLRLMRGGDLRRSQVCHVAVWGLAAIFSGLILVTSVLSRLHRALWGLWFYAGAVDTGIACANDGKKDQPGVMRSQNWNPSISSERVISFYRLDMNKRSPWIRV